MEPVVEKNLDDRAVADLLNVDLKHLQALLRRNKIPGAFKVGRLWRIPESALRSYIARSNPASPVSLVTR